jgi:hypothetical protein
MGKGAVQMLKISVIGGGSTYTPELINGFIENKDALPIDELWLMDVLPDRLEIVGGFAQRMVAAAGNPFQVILTTDQSDASEILHMSSLNFVWDRCRLALMTSISASGIILSGRRLPGLVEWLKRCEPYP